MKTNLDKFYKTDGEKESDGFWYDVTDTIKIKLRRFGGKNTVKMKEISTQVLKPYTKQIKANTIDPEKMDQLTIESFVRACVADWKGMEIDGVEAEFTIEKAVSVLTSLPEFAEELMNEANRIDNYKVDLGN